ncbi:hypothetical protein D3C76_1280040 [compost metagenome]
MTNDVELRPQLSAEASSHLASAMGVEDSALASATWDAESRQSLLDRVNILYSEARSTLYITLTQQLLAPDAE